MRRKLITKVVVASLLAFLSTGCAVHNGTQAPTVLSSASSTQTCAFDAECPGGSCQAGTCSPLPPASTGCSFDSDCLGGSCQMGTCSITPSITSCDDSSSLSSSSLDTTSSDDGSSLGSSSPQ